MMAIALNSVSMAVFRFPAMTQRRKVKDIRFIKMSYSVLLQTHHFISNSFYKVLQKGFMYQEQTVQNEATVANNHLVFF